MILKMGKSHENKEDDSLRQFELHEHWLRPQRAQRPYTCNGCKQPGSENCWKCPKDICDFYLHTECFQAVHDTEIYPEFIKCIFHFREAPRGADKYCDVCGLRILGFGYECSTHGENPHDLHPTCANLKLEMDWKGLKWELRDKVESKCLHCGQRYPAEEFVRFTGGKWVSKERLYVFPFCFFTGGKWVSKERLYVFPFCFSGRKICYHVKCMNEVRAPKEKKV